MVVHDSATHGCAVPAPIQSPDCVYLRNCELLFPSTSNIISQANSEDLHRPTATDARITVFRPTSDSFTLAYNYYIPYGSTRRLFRPRVLATSTIPTRAGAPVSTAAAGVPSNAARLSGGAVLVSRARRQPGVGGLVGDGDELGPVLLVSPGVVRIRHAPVRRPAGGGTELRERLRDRDEGCARGVQLREVCGCCCG
jgi:hypothetical protein